MGSGNTKLLSEQNDEQANTSQLRNKSHEFNVSKLNTKGELKVESLMPSPVNSPDAQASTSQGHNEFSENKVSEDYAPADTQSNYNAQTNITKRAEVEENLTDGMKVESFCGQGEDNSNSFSSPPSTSRHPEESKDQSNSLQEQRMNNNDRSEEKEEELTMRSDIGQNPVDELNEGFGGQDEDNCSSSPLSNSPRPEESKDHSSFLHEQGASITESSERKVDGHGDEEKDTDYPTSILKKKILEQFDQCASLIEKCESWTPKDRSRFLELMNDEGMDHVIDAKDSFGNTLLLLACNGQQIDIVQMLIRRGASLDEQNEAGFTALHYCCAPGADVQHARRLVLAKMLLKAGANPSLPEKSAGCTPLHYAAAHNNIAMCNELLENGALITTRCTNGSLAEAYARASGHNQLADVLHERLKASMSLEMKARVARRGGDGNHGWQKLQDAETGRCFYYNNFTGKSTWDRPLEMDSFSFSSGSFEAGPPREGSNPIIQKSIPRPPQKRRDTVEVELENQREREREARVKAESEREALRRQLEQMQDRFKEMQLNLEREAHHAAEMTRVAQENDARFAQELSMLQRDLEDKRANEEESKRQIERLKVHFEATKRQDIQRLKEQYEKSREEERAQQEQQRAEEREQHQRELEARMEELQKVEQQLAKELREKKQYYNEIEELKGAIRVCARIRPLNQKEIERGCTSVAEVLGNSVRITHARVDKSGEKTVSKMWTFDKVLGPHKSQEDVFEDTERLVQSALDGYNICIFAYGQTGAGKTHTMSGSPSDPGIYPRAIRKLFTAMREQRDVTTFSIELYMCELHLDSLVDLLDDKATRSDSLTVKKDQFGVVYVENITVVPIESEEELLQRVLMGEMRRSTDSTLMNDESSRSHLVISVIVKSESKVTQEITSGKLTFVDLAGSERVQKSGAEGQTFKEATSINKALSALGEVINALSTNAKHIPYRNNPLTQLMSDSLGGNAKTLMIVNVSPADYNAQESIASLNFASRCKTVKNAASKGFETQELAALRKEIAKLRLANKANLPHSSSPQLAL